jgi:uncharacterized membrane protein YhaH (DUF805 family)
MGFGEAIGTVFRQYTTFSGRARRSEYWWYALFALLLYIAGELITIASGSIVFLVLVWLVLLLPTLAVAVRRLHDTNRSGGWVFFGLIPLVGGLVLLIFMCEDGTPGSNRFGLSPKYGADPARMA